MISPSATAPRRCFSALKRFYVRYGFTFSLHAASVIRQIHCREALSGPFRPSISPVLLRHISLSSSLHVTTIEIPYYVDRFAEISRLLAFMIATAQLTRRPERHRYFSLAIAPPAACRPPRRCQHHPARSSPLTEPGQSPAPASAVTNSTHAIRHRTQAVGAGKLL